MNLSRSLPAARRALAATAIAAASLAATAGVASTPAGAIVPAQCAGTNARVFVCGSYDSFVERTPSPAEVDYWAPLLPAKKAFFLATLNRSLESRRLIVEESYWDYADRLVSDLESDYWSGELLKADGFRRLQAALYNEIEATPDDLVGWAYYGIMGREPSMAEVTYWAGVAEAKGAGRMADLLAGTEEARRTRVRFTYRNELYYFPDGVSRDYWAERLRTGTSYQDMRVALKAAEYPAISECSSHTPPARAECSID